MYSSSGLETHSKPRSFAFLPAGGSTSRILNLNAEYLRRRASGQRIKVLFNNPLLDRAIFIRHRPRPHERDFLQRPVGDTLKIVSPFDPLDLRAGGQTLLLHQRAFDVALLDLFGVEPHAGAEDRFTLSLLADLPSLDPFLVRLRLAEMHPASSSWSLSLANDETAALQGYAAAAFAPIAARLFGPSREGAAQLARWIVTPTRRRASFVEDPAGTLIAREIRETWAAAAYFLWRASVRLGCTQQPVCRLLDVACSVLGPGSSPEPLEEVRELMAKGRATLHQRTQDLLRAVDAFGKGDPQRFLSCLGSNASALADFGSLVGAVDHVQTYAASYLDDLRRVPPSRSEVLDVFDELACELKSVQ